MTAPNNPFQANPYLQGVLRAAGDDAWLQVSLNYVDLLLPTGTILTMAHCVRFLEDGRLALDVEIAHLDWMRSRLKDGAVFLDVGSSTGAMTLPIAKQFPWIEIVAFEPARRARRLLKESLVKNDIFGVKVFSAAVSDQDGVLTFCERGLSPDGSLPFLPETSTIIANGEADPHGGEIVQVDTLTLNTVASRLGLRNRSVVAKIDIEGFEVEALRGAADLLANNEVFLAIDIHQTPRGVGTTEAKCRDILASYGYLKQEMLAHVLVASK